MRIWLAALPLLSLAACGGDTGAQSVGSVAPPPAPGGSGGSGGNGTGIVANGQGQVANPNHFLNIQSAKTFAAVGSAHSLREEATGGQLYQGNASTMRSPSGEISYNPRDGIFTLTIADQDAGVNRDYRFQDPAHRSDFDGAVRPALEVPNLVDFNYLRVADGQTVADFFYQRPGTSTDYVSLAGFVRREIQPDGASTVERGAFVFGDQTVRSQVPISGTGNYTGGFLATMIVNPTLDNASPAGDYLQWMFGSSNIAIDFSASTVALSFNGQVGPAYINDTPVNDMALSVPSGATFSANGTAVIDMVRAGGFTGEFQNANFTWGDNRIDLAFDRVSPNSSTAGASSIDGGFFGPNGVNVGGSFRIVGGIPDQRIDLHGAFTGAKR